MEFTIKTSKREEFVDITVLIKEKIKEFKHDGILNIFVLHTTACVTINEKADPNISIDINNFLNKTIPRGKWLHDVVDGNTDAHIKTSLIGNSINVPVKNGKMQLGIWQGIFLCEFDGPRERKIILNFIKTKEN